MTEFQGVLDEHLFGADGTLHPKLRTFLLRTITDFLADLKLKKYGTGHWLKVWITGSALTYEHSDDLDMMIGIDWTPFTQTNPVWDGFGQQNFAAWLNAYLQDSLWPRLAGVNINGSQYQVTYYCIDTADVKDISPYAAYDVISNEWVIAPPTTQVPIPQSWQDQADEDARRIADLSTRHASLQTVLDRAPIGSPEYHNAGSALNQVFSEAQGLFDVIHRNRRLGFQKNPPEGRFGGQEGYWNYRWQAAKKSGGIESLYKIIEARDAAAASSDTELYGAKIAPADELIRRAMMYRRQG
jgi:hypothetical protein